MTTGTFDLLSPDVVFAAVEDALGCELDGTMAVYPSYVNRVYGVRDTDGTEFIAKFYRPGRWGENAIAEEHDFVFDCAEFDVPVIAPLPLGEDLTVGAIVAEEESGADQEPGTEQEFLFALFPKRGGRSFDAESDDDWLRLGAVAGRVHATAIRRESFHRIRCTPQESTQGFLRELETSGVIHPEFRDEFLSVAKQAVEWIAPLFEGVELHRIHGDFHRGNILDRPGEGLLVVDFDDMMVGPAVQDLWLLLPDRAHAVRRELNLLLEGYETFREFDRSTLRLIEPLRLMRMIYYLAWSMRQRNDLRFRESFPEWGGKAFWAKELEDLHTQIAVIRDDLEEEE